MTSSRDARAISSRRRRLVVAAAALLTVTLATFPQAARASLVSFIAPGTIRYAADAGETNVLTVSREGTTYVFEETGLSPVVIDGRCGAATSGQRAECDATGVTEIRILLYDGDDHLTIDGSVAVAAQPRILAEGGDGMDTLTGGDGPESLCGGPD